MKDFLTAKEEALKYSRKDKVWLDRHNNDKDSDPVRYAAFMAGYEWYEKHLNRTVEVKEG